MSDSKDVTLFLDLQSRYPRAAAGLLEDIFYKLKRLLQDNSGDTRSIDELCDTLAHCFRAMDNPYPDSYPWDAIYHHLGQLLLRDLPQNQAIVAAITGWSDERMTQCRADCIGFTRICRDDWIRAAKELGIP